MPGIGQSATKSNNEFIVYKITNIANGKSYIGISSRKEPARWSEHKKRAQGGSRNSRLYDAIRKYGSESFQREVIATVPTEEEVRALETRFINEFDTYENGYNSNLGGFGFLVFPDHIKAKISAAQKGKYIPPETRRRMSDAKLGDSRCAIHFGEHTKKGSLNPKSRSFRFRFPDGSERVITGLRAFCRLNGLNLSHINARGRTKGYMLLERLND